MIVCHDDLLVIGCKLRISKFHKVLFNSDREHDPNAVSACCVECQMQINHQTCCCVKLVRLINQYIQVCSCCTGTYRKENAPEKFLQHCHC